MSKERFMVLRLYNEMTQHEMAVFLNVSQSTIDAIESGVRGLSPYMRGRVAARFKLDADFEEYYENYKRTSI
ncbi:helix-turn-helix domain-containing protein [Sporosarcina siberiensis]|uniref:Helix-turn-helix domain-containing protein n=1 Tax=Sporosarcina siberiensis TaxID=1365606 RepID=A0ABW4SC66_9BACL